MPNITNSGATPIAPLDLLAEEVSAATILSPGLTTDLPGSIVEDMASTATGALVVIDQAATDLINSISPTVANGYLLYQLGQAYGIPQGVGSNTSVYVTFYSPNIGLTIIPGTFVSDGTNQYVTQNGSVIDSDGISEPVFCVSTTSGTFSVPIGTVTQVITSFPSTITITCSNLTDGIPGQPQQSLQDYRAQLLQATQATVQGVPNFLKTQLQKVAGVKSNLISVRSSGQNWQVICGGGDPYAVGNAILSALSNINELVGSTILATNITNDYGAVVTVDLNHGYNSGQIIQFLNGIGMSGINGTPFTISVTDEKTFILNVAISSIVWSGGVVTVTTDAPHNLPSSITGTIYATVPIAYNGSFTFTRTGANTFTYPLASDPGSSTKLGYTPFDSTSSGAYTINSATVTPNLRNVTVSINDYPDIYNIIFINPPAQSVTIELTWNTISPNFVSAIAIAAAANPAIVNYINSIAVGQPINIFDMQIAFQNSISAILNPNLISKMLFTVLINGVITPPVVNTGIVYGDPESYFQTSSNLVIIVQG